MPAVESSVHLDVHDRSQVELRNSLQLDGSLGPSSLEVDTYLFVPQAVGLNGNNYHRDEFYADTTALMRIEAAARSLEALVDVNDASSPLRPVADALERFKSGAGVPSSLRLALHVKIFAYALTQAVAKEVAALSIPLDAGRRSDFSSDLDAFLDRAARALASFRRLRVAMWPFEPLCHRSFISALATADEYMSVFLEERLAGLVERLEARPEHFDGSAFVPRTKERIRAFAEREAEHRLELGQLVYNTTGKKPLREYSTYRRSMLKKSIHQALYLDARNVTKDAFIKNSVGAFGAALAAVWAWATQLPATVADLPTDTKLAFFVGAVGAYVAKDRIKAATNEYLVGKFKRFDKASTIRGASLEKVGLGMFSGRLEERMRFVPFDEVDERIRSIRLQGRTVGRFLSDASATEEVIHYRKLLRVDSVDGDALPDGYGMLDIFRLNIRHFLSRLDDPTESVGYFDVDEKNFKRSKLPKVYHVNVVVRAKANDEPERFEHFRMILNKKGIVRTERIRVAA